MPVAALATLVSLRLRELPLRDFATVTTTDRDAAEQPATAPDSAIAH